MGCRCNERRDALVRIFNPRQSGKKADIARELRFIAQTSAEDLASTTRDKITAARARLTMRRR